jgi:hypothetical protein
MERGTRVQHGGRDRDRDRDRDRGRDSDRDRGRDRDRESACSTCSWGIFDNFPANLEDFWQNFIPFRCTTTFGTNLDISVFSDCDTVVDVSCSETPAFVGDAASRQFVDMRMADFVRAYQQREAALHQGSAGGAGGAEGGAEGQGALRLYLSQVPLMDRDRDRDAAAAAPAAALGEYFSPPAFPCSLERKELLSVHLWANIGRAATSLHYDAYHNFLTVLSGRKQVRLLPFQLAHTPAVGLRCAGLGSANHAVAPFHLSPSHSPSPGGGRAGPGAAPSPAPIDVEVGPGQTLFIPEGWLHQVSSEPCTLAVVIHTYMFACS